MLALSHIRWAGRWGAWAAAYALILNAILTSALAAAIPPEKFATAYELCLSGKAHGLAVAAPSIGDEASSGPVTDTKGAPMHCPMCGPHAVAIDLPSAPSLSTPVAVASPLTFAEHLPFTTLARLIFHYARGPPQLT